ncbi:MAG: hypothetical protein HY275_04755 [Gemmatimonadetes bacterium]|nr:hypothetical protein [Gemmatimonadota bacterium]
MAAQYAPAFSADGTTRTWLIGEVYASSRLTGIRAGVSRTRAVREAIAEAMDRDPIGTVRDLDGEFVLLRWQAVTRTLTLYTDRFGSLPVYSGADGDALTFASGVRAVLSAPGATAEPDLDALRDAVSYGGYRLGARTNVRGVSLLGSATALEAGPGARRGASRWWHWRDLPSVTPRSMPEAVDELRARWRHAVASRLDALERPAQTLSGGLDSRAILGEAAPLAPGWQALTYGIPACDDAHYAERAARLAKVPWSFQPLYRGGDPAWFAERLSHVMATDGLIELGDLMHAEALPWLVRESDGLVNGYIGDAVIGPTFNGIATPDDVLAALPYYGDELGEPHDAARARAAGMIAALGGAPARFALFDDKLPQSTNHAHGALWRPWLRVRRPYLTHAFFDYAQGLPADWRGARDVQAHWLAAAYPLLFRRIPNQKTGVPVGSSSLRRQTARIGRVAARSARRALATTGIRLRERPRGFTDDSTFWRADGVREAIGALLRARDARHHAAFAPGAVARVLDAWERAAAAPAQVIGALVVFEHYHRTLGAFLGAARAAAPVRAEAEWPA